MIDTSVVRSRIIDIALQGKLSNRDESDSDVNLILNDISKKKGIDTTVSKDSMPFDIPSEWRWIKLGWVMDVERGGSPRPIKEFITTQPNGINWIKIGDVAKDGKYITETREKIKPEGENKSRRVYPGDFLLTNSMSFGRPYISQIEGCIHDGWLVLHNKEEVFDLDFLYYLLSSTYAYNQFTQKASGSTVDNLNKDKVKNALVPLPSIEEQRRIVETIETIVPTLTTIDNLQEQYANDREVLKGKLIVAGIQGKLTEQLPDDGTAEELYQQIQAEKKQLEMEGKIKKSKKLPEITFEETPFEIPQNWRWVRFSDIATFYNGDRSKNYPNRSEYTASGVAWINTGHILPSGYLDKETMNYISEEKFDSLSGGKIQSGDLVYCLRGATFGKVARVEPFEKGAVASSLMIIRVIKNQIREYIYWFLKSGSAMDELHKYDNGAAQPNLAANNVAKYLIPIPPLEEMNRIVIKIEQSLSSLNEIN